MLAEVPLLLGEGTAASPLLDGSLVSGFGAIGQSMICCMAEGQTEGGLGVGLGGRGITGAGLADPGSWLELRGLLLIHWTWLGTGRSLGLQYKIIILLEPSKNDGKGCGLSKVFRAQICPNNCSEKQPNYTRFLLARPLELRRT